jgi:predicted RNase H-like nuclease
MALRDDGKGELKIVGVDGCRAGWFAVGLDGERWITTVFSSIKDLWAENSNADSILIDIPIGLRDEGPNERRCDVEARKLLGWPRRCSVFPAPCRVAVYKDTYEEASRINNELTARKLSLQSYHISRKIREVNTLLAKEPVARRVIRETHPEVCFWALADRPMEHSKRKAAGFRERVVVLESFLPKAIKIVEEALRLYLRRDVGRDDIVDALIAAVTAVGGADGLTSIPDEPEYDSVGLRMEIVYRTDGKDA